MAVTSGFFNSNAGDRKYNAEQMSAIFDGIINDGVLSNIGTAFAATATIGNTVNIGIGRAWFNSIWIFNDAILPITLDASELVLDRIDAIVFEVNKSQEVRDGTIKFVTGTPSSDPQRPAMTSTDYVHQYPICYILRPAGSTSITQATITNAVGTSETPYVTGILQVQNIDNIVAQWSAQWVEWFAFETGKTTSEANAIIEQWSQWYEDFTLSSSAEFDQWFESLQAILDGDVAANLTNEVLKLNERFDILAEKRAIFTQIEDSSEDKLLDSNGYVIEGRTVFGDSTGSGSGNTIMYSHESHLYKATFLLDSWAGEGPYTQTAVVIPVNGGDAITEQSIMSTPVSMYDGYPSDTKNILIEALGLIDQGHKTFGSGTITCVCEDYKPACDIEVFFNVEHPVGQEVY